MTRTYHIPFSSDSEATTAHQVIKGKVSAAAGTAHVARSFGNGRAFVVVNLPDELDTEAVNQITHPHTANEVIEQEIANAQDDEDDDLPFDEEDEEDDDSWAEGLYLDDDEEGDGDEPEEGPGDSTGTDSGGESASEAWPASEASASVGSPEGDAE